MKALPPPKKAATAATSPSDRLELLKKSFVASLQHPSNSLTERSRATYTSAIDLFFRYLKAQRVRKLTRSHIENFQAELRKDYTRAARKWRSKDAEAAYSVAWQNIIAASMRYFFKWAKKRKIINYLPYIATTKPEDPDPDNLSKKEVIWLLRFASERIANAKSARQRQHFLQIAALVFTLAHTGLRINEAVNLQWSNLRNRKNKWQLVVSRGKGGKARIVPVNKQLLAALQQYREACSRYKKTKSAYGPMFRSSQHGDSSISSRTAQYAIEKLYKQARIAYPKVFGRKKIHAHLFRHTMGTLLAEKKVAAGMIQRLLGHSNVSITEQYYIKRSEEELAKTANFYGTIIGR